VPDVYIADDETSADEANPFAADEPEWFADETSHAGATDEPSADSTARATVAVGDDAAPPRSKGDTLLPGLEIHVAAAEPAVAAPSLVVSPPALMTIAERAPRRPRTARIVFRRSRSLEADRHRLFELVELLSGFTGDDRFVIVVEANGKARYELDFPNNYTRICRELTSKLDQRLGAGAWQVMGE
jgi:hypothetical protein